MRLHLLQFDSENAAINDLVVSEYYMPPDLPPEDPDYLPGTWQGGNVFPNETVYLNDIQESGWWMIIGGDDNDLPSHPNCRLAWDNESAVVVGGTFEGNDIAVLWVTPVPAGAYNPWPYNPPPEPEP